MSIQIGVLQFYNNKKNVKILIIFFISGSDWVDPEDPTVIAENELLGAAASIDAAAKKLASLRPRQNMKVNNIN